MSLRSNGSYIGARPTGPSSSVASGIWDLRTAERQKRANAWPGDPVDPDFASVSLLLHMDGSNGSTTFTDSSGSPKTVTSDGGAAISTAQSKFGGSSVLFDGTNDNLIIGSSSDMTFGTEPFVVEFWFYTTNNAGNLSNYATFFSGGVGAVNLRYVSDYNSLSVGVEGTSYDLSPGSSSLPIENSWNHIAVVRDATDLRLYLNGTRLGTASAGKNYSAAITRIGRYEASALYHLDGYIDEFRVTKGTVRGYTGATIPVPTAPFPDQ